ncbi:MAG: sorbosone dehydrogenase family protein [Rhodobacteraceae bacterium]|nr:sorbosone dehydrogenase family protein [Paracoccaceae bacterium]
MFALASLVSACADGAGLTPAAGVGPDPTLPAPTESLLPTVNIARAVGWQDGETPRPAEDLAVTAFATGLDHPRWLLALPNGDVLVAETNAQPKPAKGPREFIEKRIMAIAGAEVPSADRISLLRDADGDGVAEMRVPLLTGLTSPFGMALVGDHLYVANTDALVRFPFAPGETSVTAPAERVAALPAGDPNRHWTKGLVASADGRTLFVSVGSNSDHAENGMEAEAGRAAIWAIDAGTGAARVFASGLRNPVGMDFEPETGALWAAVNERDELGDDLVPDYLTSVRDGGFYGWPYSYYGAVVDTRVTPQRPELVATALKPDYALGAHTASLGLAFSDGADLGPRFAQGVFVGQHGSWNRKPRSGYRVIFVPFRDGAPAGDPVEVLTGFRRIRPSSPRP